MASPSLPPLAGAQARQLTSSPHRGAFFNSPSRSSDPGNAPSQQESPGLRASLNLPVPDEKLGHAFGGAGGTHLQGFNADRSHRSADYNTLAGLGAHMAQIHDTLRAPVSQQVAANDAVTRCGQPLAPSRR